MNCPNCKKEIDNNHTHCPFCGIDLTGIKPSMTNWQKPSDLSGSAPPNQAEFKQQPPKDSQHNPQYHHSYNPPQNQPYSSPVPTNGGGYNPPPIPPRNNNIPQPPGGGNRPPKKPSIVVPIILLTLSFILIGVVIFLMGGIGEGSQNSPKSAFAQKKQIEYNPADLEKKAPDISALTTLLQNNSQSTQAAFNTQVIEDAIAQAEAEVAASYPNINEDTVQYYIREVSRKMSDLRSKNLISNYNVNSTCIRIDLIGGGSYMYAPEIEGCDSGDDSVPDLKVATYQPCFSGYEDPSLPLNNVDNGASKIAAEFPAYSFDSRNTNDDSDYNDSEVNLNECASFGQYNVLLWHGHGAFDSTYGSLLVIGTERSAENDATYRTAIMNNDILISDKHYLISSTFIDNYVPDGSLDNSIVYLGACSSGKDNKLAQAFLNKGAQAVYANSNTIHTYYNLDMIESVCEGLCQKNSDGSYYNVEDALKYAKQQNGEKDTPVRGTRAETILISDNKNFALDWYIDKRTAERDVVLVLDTSGSMDGTPIRQTKEAAEKFVKTTLGEDALIGLVTYSSNAVLESDFTRKEGNLTKIISNLRANGGTNIDVALQKANEMLSKSKADKKIIVLMSDGEPNSGRQGTDLINYADTIKKNDIYIYTLGFFTSLNTTEKTSAQHLMESIASDGCHYEVENADDLVFFFGDIADQINGQKYVYVRIACPVDVSVTHNNETLSSTDDLTRTSYGTLSFEENRENTVTDHNYKGDNRVKILRLKDGEKYDIKIAGNGNGTMNYTIAFMDENGKYTDFRNFENIAVTSLSEMDTTANSGDKTKLKIDSDGDGRYDHEYEAGENETGQPVSKAHIYFRIAILIIALFTALASAIILLVQLRKRKRFCAYYGL